jgi:PAS domain S-box-containing protein
MVDTVPSAGLDAARRDEIIDAISFAAERLLLARDVHDVIGEVLSRLGEAADVSRAYLLANDTGPEGALRLSQAAEWCAPSIGSQADNPILRDSDWTRIGFARWVEVMQGGGLVAGDVADFPDAERRALEGQGITSILALPIQVEGEWWGCIGLDECRVSRDWGSGEVEALRTAAALLGAALTRQRTDDRLRRAEERYRSVVEHIPAVTYFDLVNGTTAHLGFVSPQIESLLGYPYERFLADPEWWFTLIHPDDKERFDAAASITGNAEDAVFDEEYRMLAADGSWVWVHDTTTPVRDEGGRITHFQGFMIDVTARHAAEAAAETAQERYRHVVEQIPAVTYIDEPPGPGQERARLSFVSPQIEQILGFPPSAFIDDPELWFRLMHPDDEATLDALGVFDATDDRPYDAEYRMRTSEGEWRWVHDAAIAVHDANGGLRYFQGFMTDVTARHEAEEAAAAAQARYREMVETIPAVTYVDEPADGPDGPTARMTFVSPQIAALLGIEPDRFVEDQTLWTSLMHPEDLASLRITGALQVTNTAPFDAEYRMRHADGRWVWVHDFATPVFRDDGSVAYFQGFAIDVSARREAERAATEADQRFRSIVERSPAIVYSELVEDGSTRAVTMDYVSPAAETMLGYPLERWYHDVDFWQAIVHPDDAARIDELIERSNETGEPLVADYRVIAADGRTVWLHEEAALAHDDAGVPARWHGMMFDVTERTHAEAAIRAAEERYRLIVEHTPAITYQESAVDGPYDPASSMVYVSPQVEAILGYSPEDWSEAGFWTRVVHPGDLAAVIELSAATNGSGEPYTQDYRMVAADGRVVWVHDESRAVRDADGRITTWQGVLTDITERKLAEERLRSAQDRLQALIDHIPAAVYVEALDADPARFYISPAIHALLGYMPDEWTWTPGFWEARIHPDDRERVLAADRDTDMSLDRFSLDYRMRHADGSWRWVHDEAAFVQPSDGEGFWQGFLYDLTDHKVAEERLLAAERVYRATVEHLPAVVYREPPRPEEHPDDMYISPQVVGLLGYTAEEWRAALPTFWFDHLHPDDRERVTAANAVANETKAQFAEDYRLRHRDGSYVWVHDEATFVPDDTEDGGWWQGFFLDITERMGADRALREAEEQFRTIVEQSPAVIYTQEVDPVDGTSRTTYISPRQPEVFGYTAEEVLADPTLWIKTIHPEDRDRVLSADRDSNREDDASFSLEYRMIAKDGRIVWVQDQATMVQVDGRPPFWQGFLLDITERKHAEEQLERALEVEREATRSLRALDDMKNTFLQAVSHDLRTPLAAILGLAITLERGDVHLEETESKDLARRIATNARRLDRLVTNLLDLDRLARGIVEPKLAFTDVGAVVRRVLAESELVSDARLRTDIRAVTQPVDAAKLERIVENLLANAVRHTPSTSTIWVSLVPGDGGAELAVEDDGPGIAPDLRETVFDAFRQGPDAPQHSPGVGVGLALVRRFAELHGGRAWVRERHGGGASFRVWLPADPRPATDPD